MTATTSSAATTANGVVLAMRGVSKRFGAVQALQEIDLDVRAGEVMALVGDNGAGKSTLVKAIAGVYTPDGGSMTFDGSEARVTSPVQAQRLGIATVFQDLALCDNLDVVANMYLGREMTGTRMLDEIAMERSAMATLKGLSVRTLKSVRAPVSALSGGQRQTVAIARAVLWNSKLVILDEPTAALGVAQTEQVLQLVRRLADRGLAVILISHNMNDVIRVADRVVALYLGRTAAQVTASESSTSQIVELITSGRSGDIGLSAEESGAVA